MQFTLSYIVCLYYMNTAYLIRQNFNVFMVDWSPLTVYPCYLSSLRNTRLVSQCTAQLYTQLTYSGASAYDIHCVGHSLGAHICGMMSSYLTKRQHKIIGEHRVNYVFIGAIFNFFCRCLCFIILKMRFKKLLN